MDSDGNVVSRREAGICHISHIYTMKGLYDEGIISDMYNSMIEEKLDGVTDENDDSIISGSLECINLLEKGSWEHLSQYSDASVMGLNVDESERGQIGIPSYGRCSPKEEEIEEKIKHKGMMEIYNNVSDASFSVLEFVGANTDSARRAIYGGWDNNFDIFSVEDERSNNVGLEISIEGGEGYNSYHQFQITNKSDEHNCSEIINDEFFETDLNVLSVQPTMESEFSSSAYLPGICEATGVCSDGQSPTERTCINHIWHLDDNCSGGTATTREECISDGGTWNTAETCSDSTSTDRETCESQETGHTWTINDDSECNSFNSSECNDAYGCSFVPNISTIGEGRKLILSNKSTDVMSTPGDGVNDYSLLFRQNCSIRIRKESSGIRGEASKQLRDEVTSLCSQRNNNLSTEIQANSSREERKKYCEGEYNEGEDSDIDSINEILRIIRGQQDTSACGGEDASDDDWWTCMFGTDGEIDTWVVEQLGEDLRATDLVSEKQDKLHERSLENVGCTFEEPPSTFNEYVFKCAEECEKNQECDSFWIYDDNSEHKGRCCLKKRGENWPTEGDTNLHPSDGKYFKFHRDPCERANEPDGPECFDYLCKRSEDNLCVKKESDNWGENIDECCPLTNEDGTQTRVKECGNTRLYSETCDAPQMLGEGSYNDITFGEGSRDQQQRIYGQAQPPSPSVCNNRWTYPASSIQSETDERCDGIRHIDGNDPQTPNCNVALPAYGEGRPLSREQCEKRTIFNFNHGVWGHTSNTEPGENPDFNPDLEGGHTGTPILRHSNAGDPFPHVWCKWSGTSCNTWVGSELEIYHSESCPSTDASQEDNVAVGIKCQYNYETNECLEKPNIQSCGNITDQEDCENENICQYNRANHRAIGICSDICSGLEEGPCGEDENCSWNNGSCSYVCETLDEDACNNHRLCHYKDGQCIRKYSDYNKKTCKVRQKGPLEHIGGVIMKGQRADQCQRVRSLLALPTSPDQITDTTLTCPGKQCCGGKPEGVGSSGGKTGYEHNSLCYSLDNGDCAWSGLPSSALPLCRARKEELLNTRDPTIGPTCSTEETGDPGRCDCAINIRDHGLSDVNKEKLEYCDHLVGWQQETDEIIYNQTRLGVGGNQALRILGSIR